MAEHILFLTHKLNGSIKESLSELNAQKGDREMTILSHGDKEWFDQISQKKFVYGNEVIDELEYPSIGDGIIPGHAHFPVLKWFYSEENRSEDFFWVIEYDVRFTGNWSLLFDYYRDNRSDFITAYIMPFNTQPDWYWWDLEHPEKEIPPEKRLRSFNPIYRISKRAIHYLNQQFRNGWKGHNEVIIPTLLHQGGYNLLDLNKWGEFSAGRSFCISRSDRRGWLSMGTMRYRPAVKKKGFRKNMLYHPVKESAVQGRLRSAAGSAWRTLNWKLNKLNNS
ncbi:MAG: hypothetical protein JJU46_10435 [Balneolaceae bacterium]|nr:hypothetical protein [Balneolaceae bacterium]MCH8549466.1 hypothetical protein [Balneolaceae bacterium]